MHYEIKNYLKNLIEHFVYGNFKYDVYTDMLPKNVLSGIYVEHINEDENAFIDITGTKNVKLSFYISLSDEYSETSSKICYLEKIADFIKERFDSGNIHESQKRFKAVSMEKINSAFIEEKNEKSVIYKIKIQFNYLEVM